MNGKYYVVCGNYNEFSHFIQQKSLELFGQGDTSISLSNFVYLDSAEKLRGVAEPTGWFYGTWKNNPNIEDIMIALSCSLNGTRLRIIQNLWKEYRKSQE